MESSFAATHFDIFEIYRRYCEITSGAFDCGTKGQLPNEEYQNGRSSREALIQLSKLVESRPQSRLSVLEGICNLMMRLDLLADFSEFSRFYDFVFFICRENGQKNITVSRAVMAWRLVLAGRFQLLNLWCNFVEKNQQHNISEDTWRQVLSFSRCVQDNLEGYDPRGAWPVLIDEFVEHLYRVGIEAPSSICSCCDSETRPSEYPLPGVESLPGLKRKACGELQGGLESLEAHYNSDTTKLAKKRKINSADICMNCEEDDHGSGADDCMEVVKQNSQFGSSNSPCAVEGCLSKGFAGLFSSSPCSQFNRGRGVSWT